MSEASNDRRTLVGDAVAGVSVALVLVPQSMAYAELAGLPAHYGLYAAALPALAASFFASSPYVQTGPVATTSLLTVGAVASLVPIGDPSYPAVAALLALVVGVTRILLGLLRAGAVTYLMSQPVLQGFVAAAGLLILTSQLPAAVGVVRPDGNVLTVWTGTFSQVQSWHWQSVGITAVSIAVMLGGARAHPLFPGVLLAVVAGIVMVEATPYEGAVLGEVPNVIFPPISVSLPWERLGELLVPGLIIALVGFAEATSIAQTYAQKDRMTWDPNKDFISQGVANVAAALSGAFPVGASFSRSAVGRLAGAQTARAGGITGLAALVVLPFAGVFSSLPEAVLAAIVIASVLKLLDPRPLWQAWRLSRLQGMVGFVTFGLTIALAPHIEYAVLAGIGAALGVHVWREQQVGCSGQLQGSTLLLTPSGVIWFGSAPLFRHLMVQEIAKHPSANRIRINLEQTGRIDLTGALMLQKLIEGMDDTEVVVSGVPKHAKRIISRVCDESRVQNDNEPQQEALE